MEHSISPENESFIQSEIADGVYNSREDVLDAGIEMLRERKELLTRLRDSRRQLDEGEFEEFSEDELESLFASLKGRITSKGRKSHGEP